MSEKQLKLMNALRAQNRLTEEEEDLLKELESEFIEKEDIIVEFLQEIDE